MNENDKQAEPVQDEISRLWLALKKANEQAEHFEREWYLRGDEIEALKAQPVQPAVAINEQLLEALKLADAALEGAHMNADVVYRKVKLAIAAAEAAKGVCDGMATD